MSGMVNDWGYSIEYKRVGAEDYTRNPTGWMAGGGAGMDAATAALIRDMTYYQSLGYEIAEVSVKEHCAACAGRGQVYRSQRELKKLYPQMKNCKDCKGTGNAQAFSVKLLPEATGAPAITLSYEEVRAMSGEAFSALLAQHMKPVTGS